MNKVFLGLLLLLNISCVTKRSLFDQKEIYSAEEIKPAHKKIAVLPVNFAINQDSEYLINKIFTNGSTDKVDPAVKQEENSHKIQQMIYEELSKSHQELFWLSDKNVNYLLKEKGIDFNKLRVLSKADIAKELEVDAVIYCDVFLNATIKSTEGLTAITSARPTPKHTKIQTVEFTVELYSGIEENLLWKAKAIFDRGTLYIDKSFRRMIKSDLASIIPLN
ncbi:hypothetical protein [Emticicia fontis]